jgi:hypothetical protein
MRSGSRLQPLRLCLTLLLPPVLSGFGEHDECYMSVFSAVALPMLVSSTGHRAPFSTGVLRCRSPLPFSAALLR